MKRQEIRSEVEKHLGVAGFSAEAWVWYRSELLIAVGGVMKRISMKAGMSKRALSFELGRISGWAELIVMVTLPGEETAPQLRLVA